MDKSSNGLRYVEAGLTSEGYRLRARLNWRDRVYVELQRANRINDKAQPYSVTFYPRAKTIVYTASWENGRPIPFDPTVHTFSASSLLNELRVKAEKAGWTASQLEDLDRIAVKIKRPENHPGRLGRFGLSANLGMQPTGYDLAVRRLPLSSVEIVQTRKEGTVGPDEQIFGRNGLRANIIKRHASRNGPVVVPVPVDTDPELFLETIGDRSDDLVARAAHLPLFAPHHLRELYDLIEGVDALRDRFRDTDLTW